MGSFIFYSFSARISLILIFALVATTSILYQLNQHVERNFISEVHREQLDLAEAIDIAQRSLSSTQWLSDFLKDRRLQGSPRSSVHRILVVNSKGIVEDSSDAADIGKQFRELGFGDYRTDRNKRYNLYSFEVETDKGKLDLVIVVATAELPELLRSASRRRLLVTFGVLLVAICISLVLVLQFTRPVSDLIAAAKKVAAGDFDVFVTTKRHDEIGRFVQVFNEMVAGLRERHELEQKLYAAQRSALVGRLASGIAHEVKNPLNYISLSIDYLRSKYAPAEPAARQEYFERIVSIKEEIKRLDRLIRNFLSYGRPIKLDPKPVSVKELMLQSIALCKDQAEQQGISIELSCSEELQIEADFEQLRSCFSNLLLNAVQAMPAGGELRVLCSQSGEALEVSICDTGVGIDEQDIDKIFEPYFSTKETGTGLGLALVRRIVGLHSGKIEVQSKVGAGTTFRVWLPIRPPSSDQMDLTEFP
ncbi:MAG: ATP-binding protein [Acidobacteriota bacterium]|nr:ATP-binding protein [Blastocatellia bacterium]MDW8411687.1 ATP-binding protein [Acidobacteriota bacterium]